MSSEPRQRPTLETLLQLKRAERPAPEFWEKFDRELRQKQLAALVQERRWWQRLNLGLPRWAYAPAGAAAALALSIVSLRMVMPVAETPVPVTIQRDVASKADTSLPPVATNLTSGESTPVSVAATESASSAPAVTGQDAAPAPTAESIEAGLTQRVLAGVAEMSPSARTIAASLARLEETDPDLVRSLQTVRFSDARPVRPAVEVQPAAALASWTAGNSRISRLAVADIAYNRPFTPEPAAPEVLRERMARRLGDTDFGSRSRRLDLEGDRLHLRF